MTAKQFANLNRFFITGLKEEKFNDKIPPFVFLPINQKKV